MRDHSRFEDRMTLFAHTRHTLALSVAMLLVFTAAAPLCLMPPEPAMAMSIAWTGQQVELDCDAESGESGSMAGCEFHARDDVPATVSDPQPSSVLASLPLHIEPMTVDQGASERLDTTRASSPVAPPVPLRL